MLGTELLRLYFALATLRLYQPPAIEAKSLLNLADSLNIVRPGTPSTIDIFFRAKSALEAYFDSLFALSLDFYPIMPMSIASSFVWSVTMLARWAKVMGPGRSHKASTSPPDILTPQKIIWDPSALKPTPSAMFGRGLAPMPSFEAGFNDSERDMRAAARKKSTSREHHPYYLVTMPPTITDPSQIQAADMHDVTDPYIARVVGRLKAQLHSQPGLNLDIIGILATVAQRLEQAHKNLIEASPDGSWQNDFWYLGAKKVLIARARLEKWAEITAAGGVTAEERETITASEGQQKADQSVEMSQISIQTQPRPHRQEPSTQPVQQYASHALTHWDALDAFQRQIEAAGVEALPPDTVYEPDMYGSVWNDNLFDTLDPNLWLSDEIGWGAAFSQDILPGL